MRGCIQSVLTSVARLGHAGEENEAFGSSKIEHLKGLTHEERAEIFQGPLHLSHKCARCNSLPDVECLVLPGYMICCGRQEKDIPPPAYVNYYEAAFPLSSFAFAMLSPMLTRDVILPGLAYRPDLHPWVCEERRRMRRVPGSIP